MAINRGSGTLLAAVLIAGTCLMTAPQASASTTNTFEFDISDADDQFDRWDGEGCGNPPETSPYYYETATISVSESGSYTYEDIGVDGPLPPYLDAYVGIYEFGAFNPSSLSTGCVNVMDDDRTVILAAGLYTLVVAAYEAIGVGDYTGLAYFSLTGPGSISLVNSEDSSPRDLSIWHQSIGRAGPAESCPEGYYGSWAQWPNDNSGGWVCNKDVYVYYPNEVVR